MTHPVSPPTRPGPRAAARSNGNVSERVNEVDVAIVGGGPVGTGLAIELGQRGVRTLVIERHPEPQQIPKGQNLTQRTMEHFHFWGAEKQLRAARTIPLEYGIGGVTAYGTLLGEFHYDWLQRELVRPFYFMDNERLPQYATERVLRARAAEIASIDFLYGWTADSSVQDGSSVTLGICASDGADRGQVRAKYVVGCDGARSKVRERAGITQTRTDHDRLMVLLVFRSEELNRLLSRYPGKSFYNVLTPELQGYWQFFGRVDLEGNWFFHAPVPRSAADGVFDFEAYVHAAAGATFDIDVSYKGFWDLRFALADTYCAGRVSIAGDAAHSHPPYGGYGVNSGLEDARNLGWKLAAVTQGWGDRALLDSYDAERRPVFASTIDDFIARSIARDREFLAAFDPRRDRGAFEQEWQRRASGAVEEVGAFVPNYCASPIVWGAAGATTNAVGKHEFRAKAGHHLAPAQLVDGDNVYHRLGSGFTLLDFSDGAASTNFEAAARQLGIPLDCVRFASDSLAERYEARVILVRPDQFISWCSNELCSDPSLVLRRASGRI